mgnify:CR=1 FL=1
MCGITGFVDGNHRTTEAVLKAMTDIIAHRGPDGDGHYTDSTTLAAIGLGHRRLSIIDLSHAASQPMTAFPLHIVFNGEIYNYAEIQKELMAKGHQFQTHSDTEVILHAWQEWGPNCLHKFHGMFAFAIYDQQEQKLFLVRDRAGAKPLFWYQQNGLFLFGSELKSFHQHPDFIKELDHSALAAYLQYGYVPTPHCIFRNTYKLRPGHYLELDINNQHGQEKEYWNVLDLYNQPKWEAPLPELISETEKILERSFQYRMVADVPVGVFLSGGYDSTLVTALLQKNSGSRIKTFTIGVHDKGLNEADFAKQTAAHLGTDHTEYYCSTKEALEIVPGLPFHYDEPFADSSAIPTTLVSKLAREKVTVALSADAGDEIFAGYNKYDYIARAKKKIDYLPSPLRKTLAALMKQLPAHKIPYFSSKPLFTTRYKKIVHLLKDNSATELLHNMSSLFFEEDLQQLLIHQPQKLSSYFQERLKPAFEDDLSYMMAIDYKTYMLDDILQKVDRATMTASLEGREPFLDQDIIEFAARIPSAYKMHNGTKKYILREIVHRYVPKEMMERPKMGFGIPIGN